MKYILSPSPLTKLPNFDDSSCYLTRIKLFFIIWSWPMFQPSQKRKFFFENSHLVDDDDLLPSSLPFPLYHLESRWRNYAQLTLVLVLSPPLTNRHLLGVASHRSFHHSVSMPWIVHCSPLSGSWKFRSKSWYHGNAIYPPPSKLPPPRTRG